MTCVSALDSKLWKWVDEKKISGCCRQRAKAPPSEHIWMSRVLLMCCEDNGLGDGWVEITKERDCMRLGIFSQQSGSKKVWYWLWWIKWLWSVCTVWLYELYSRKRSGALNILYCRKAASPLKLKRDISGECNVTHTVVLAVKKDMKYCRRQHFLSTEMLVDGKRKFRASLVFN